MVGNKLYIQAHQATSGFNKMQMDLSTYAAGNYILILEGEGVIEKTQITKLWVK